MKRKFNLSSVNTPITTTYAGEFAGEYISAALLSGVTLDRGGVTIKQNVKYKEVIKKVSTTDFIAAGSCDFTPTADAISLPIVTGKLSCIR